MIQITIIVSSFLILAYYEQERTLFGNSINVAGKNRLLTIVSNTEIKHDLVSGTKEKYESLNSLESNIYFLKEGGYEDELQLKPIPVIFENDIKLLEKTFSKYKDSSLTLLRTEKSSNEYDANLLKFETNTQTLLLVADNFTDSLSEYDKQISELMLFLEMLLLITNVALHLILILMIISIFRSESIKLVKTEKFVTIGELSARIAHDLKNPLSIVIMALDLIQKNENLNPQSIEKIKIAQKAVLRMDHQINDVMNYVRTSPLKLTTNKIDEIIQEALIHTNIPKTISVEYTKNQKEIFCDKDKMIIVLINIFKNACDAIQGKGKLTINIQSQPQNLQIEIENSGPPIPPKDLKSIFTSLFTSRSHGTGLGLATCKNIISEHNGTISALNHPTRFIINLPTKF